jgi:hypothetical protein
MTLEPFSAPNDAMTFLASMPPAAYTCSDTFARAFRKAWLM